MTSDIKKKKKANLANIDAGHLVTLGVPIAELGHRGDGVEAGVLCQCEGDHLQGIAVGPHAVRLHAAQRARVLCQAQRQLDLGGATAGYQGPEGGGRGQEVRLRQQHPGN